MKKKPPFKLLLSLILLAGLAASFWYSAAWLTLCYGLALFLFGMQCIEEGLQQAAGGTLERLMAKSTATPAKGLLFGISATFILQSSTLVSLLAIAFLSTGLITLAGGIAVILGTNLGATSGIWLLALAGQSISLSPAALPMLVFGILAGFFDSRAKAAGRILVGIALIFLGIDAIKEGFQALGGHTDFAALKFSGAAEVAVFCGIGLLLTIVLQSSHATLILTLAALAGGQIGVAQAFAVAIGSNVGSSVSTAFVGMLGSERSGQRLALAHLLFNTVTALLSLILWLPLTQAVTALAAWLGMGSLLQLALFHTLFNLLGLAVFWKLQPLLAAKLLHWLPDKAQAALLPEDSTPVRTHYLNENMLRSGETALRALFQETGRLHTLCLEVLCHILFIPTERLHHNGSGDLPLPQAPLRTDAQAYYESQIKPLYSELLDFAGKTDTGDETRGQQLAAIHSLNWQMVEIVKEGKHLQKNLQQYLGQPDSPVFKDYLRLRRHLFHALCLFCRIRLLPLHSPERSAGMAELHSHTAALENFRARILVKLRRGKISGWQTSSLMNDINYARRIGEGIGEILHTLETADPTRPVQN